MKFRLNRYGPIPWLMMGEIFPARIRGSAAAIATAFNWSCTFMVTKSFPEAVAAFGGYTVFLGFALVCFTGIFFVIFLVPETKGTKTNKQTNSYVRVCLKSKRIFNNKQIFYVYLSRSKS